MGNGKFLQSLTFQDRRLESGRTKNSNKSATNIMPKTRKFNILMKHVWHASQIPSSNQSPPCHSADRKNPLSPSPTSKFYQDMGLRTVLQSGCPKENAYSTPS
ncbi:uncharacterized protein TNCV_5137231 [Trichonephila clavipes]|nr:uncharacterized protein TNCV_5137231 [Trichonephila clavipes]